MNNVFLSFSSGIKVFQNGTRFGVQFKGNGSQGKEGNGKRVGSVPKGQKNLNTKGQKIDIENWIGQWQSFAELQHHWEVVTMVHSAKQLMHTKDF